MEPQRRQCAGHRTQSITFDAWNMPAFRRSADARYAGPSRPRRFMQVEPRSSHLQDPSDRNIASWLVLHAGGCADATRSESIVGPRLSPWPVSSREERQPRVSASNCKRLRLTAKSLFRVADLGVFEFNVLLHP